MLLRADGLPPWPAIPITAGSFNANVSLEFVAGQVCRLAVVPVGTTVTAATTTVFTGPPISVSSQETLTSNGSAYGDDIIVGDPSWGYQLDSLEGCPVHQSYSTDPTNYGSYSLFSGDGCLPNETGSTELSPTRSAIQVDGVNAYLPADLLTALGGFDQLGYSPSWDANHDTVTVSETDPLSVCAPPGAFPPTNPSNCPSLSSAGIQAAQTTTVLPGDQVARVVDQFSDTDGKAHTLDLLFSDSVHAYASGAPGFEFPNQSVFASHGSPDTYGPFPTGPGTIYVVADSSQSPALSNPVGAITYSTPPQGATFTNPSAAATSTFLMHYVESLPAGGSVTLQWSFSQAASAASLGPLVQLEIDRFYTPTVTVAAPAQGMRTDVASVTVSGQAYDPEGISAVTVDGRAATVSPSGDFRTVVPLQLGSNTIQITATNLAGVQGSAERVVVYSRPPCIVPKLAGRTLARARRMLSSGGCRAGRVMHKRSRRVKRGRVLATTPRAGTHRAHGTVVKITLSAGAPRARRR